MPVLDVLVLGKGPAGLAAAAAAGAAGLRAGVLGPSGPPHWPAEYGAWAPELERLGLPQMARHVWPDTVVHLGGGDLRVLGRSYVRVDKERLSEHLLEECQRAGVEWRGGEASSVSHSAAESRVALTDGSEIGARVVVDATGHRPVLARRRASPEPGYQTAFGGVVEYEGPLFPEGRAVLMDWEDSAFPPAERERFASFLYALPLGSGKLFVEETVLVARPAVPLESLQRRLRLRLAALGLPSTIEEIERCWIPMGGALPDLDQRIVGFGGAGGMVHPASGYLLTRVLDDAPRLAAALARELGGGAPPAVAARAAWQALWPRDRIHRRDLFCFGMEALLAFRPHELRTFFGAFFSLSPAHWQGYLDDRFPAPELRRLMARLFLLAPGDVRRALAGTALRRPGIPLIRSLVAQLRA